MPCTTILVGKNATYNGSTMMARNEDSGPGYYATKKFVVVKPEEQPRLYKSVISGVEIPLPENPMRYTSMPNGNPVKGIWGEAGFNELNVAMSETETITSNARVLGADPLVKTGIGEEDMLTIVLPYIKSAREGVLRLAELLETYGTYEMNGIGFQDENEVWWMETIGGHHFIAKRVPDDSYAVIPNQQGIDFFDFKDAFSEQENCICSKDMIDFIRNNHLDLCMAKSELSECTDFYARDAFGSHSDSDHSYNTPRAWAMERYLNPNTYIWDGEDADYKPESDDIPWCLVPEHKITPEDVKYALSIYYQGTKFNPYAKYGDLSEKGKYRPIGINRNNFVALTELRPDVPAEIKAVEWIAEGSNAFNEFVPFYANITETPDYFGKVTETPSTESFYWANRLIAALADSHYSQCIQWIERYQNTLSAEGHAFLNRCDSEFINCKPEDVHEYLEKCNQQMSDVAKRETDNLLNMVLLSASNEMKNGYSRADA